MDVPCGCLVWIFSVDAQCGLLSERNRILLMVLVCDV
ncbi:hypothetical protein MNBD_GAMMA10-2621 [hydrothermal vent metagenome]|uniref:Uncharacterized protein n=1 Tax=hydrothermal vent metagenome TaxID=652676 RepID=A0A3B0XV69_9ZZZZ